MAGIVRKAFFGEVVGPEQLLADARIVVLLQHTSNRPMQHIGFRRKASLGNRGQDNCWRRLELQHSYCSLKVSHVIQPEP